MQFKTIGVFLLLILGSANLFAEPGGHRRDVFNSVRAYQMQDMASERGEQFDSRRVEPESERRHRGFDQHESSGYGSQGEASPPPDNMRRQGRLSPEERRALRRQIDEAGHDIYTPKR